jgi:hypothetical protein
VTFSNRTCVVGWFASAEHFEQFVFLHFGAVRVLATLVWIWWTIGCGFVWRAFRKTGRVSTDAVDNSVSGKVSTDAFHLRMPRGCCDAVCRMLSGELARVVLEESTHQIWLNGETLVSIPAFDPSRRSGGLWTQL